MCYTQEDQRSSGVLVTVRKDGVILAQFSVQYGHVWQGNIPFIGPFTYQAPMKPSFIETQLRFERNQVRAAIVAATNPFNNMMRLLLRKWDLCLEIVDLFESGIWTEEQYSTESLIFWSEAIA